ncbi:MAG: hypothetical protein ACJAQ6_000802 [Arenicella sp.]|jgi:hypothetical protein
MLVNIDGEEIEFTGADLASISIDADLAIKLLQTDHANQSIHSNKQ